VNARHIYDVYEYDGYFWSLCTSFPRGVSVMYSRRVWNVQNVLIGFFSKTLFDLSLVNTSTNMSTKIYTVQNKCTQDKCMQGPKTTAVLVFNSQLM
jgi:hypothetical protein